MTQEEGPPSNRRPFACAKVRSVEFNVGVDVRKGKVDTEPRDAEGCVRSGNHCGAGS